VMRMMMLCVLVLGLWISGISQQRTDAMLFGDVKSKGTGEHIPFASIVVKGHNTGTMADHTGHYKLAHLPLGSVTVIARATGYKPTEVEIVMCRDSAMVLFFELETDIIELEQIVVTGTRTEHSVRDVPVRTELITASDIENRNASTLFQALEGVPGVRVENQCQACNFTMVRMQGLSGEHTQILINGQPMFSGLAGVYGLQQLSTIDVSRIEVVKGAGSALYGSSAIAGAINIITKEPTFNPGTTLNLQFGNHNSNRFDISSSMRNTKGNIGVQVFARRLTEGLIDQTGEGETRQEVFQSDGISDRVASTLTNAGFGLYFYGLLKNNDRLVIRGRVITEQRDGGELEGDLYRNPFSEGTESILTDRYESELSYTVPIRNNTEMVFTMGYANHKRSATSDAFLLDYKSMHNDTLPDLNDMRPYMAAEHTLTSTLSLSRRINSHHLMVGLQGYMSRLNESGMYVVVDPDSDFAGLAYRSEANKRAGEIGLFLQDEWHASGKLMIVPGVRFDRHISGEKYIADHDAFENISFPETTFDQTSINPRLAVKYNLTRNFTLRATAGTGYRAPYGFSEDLHLCSGSPRVWKSSSLEPETSVSYNLTADYYMDTKANFSVNFFRTNLQNKIEYTIADEETRALGYDYMWENVDNAFVQGVELSFQAGFLKYFRAGIDFTINKGEFTNIRDDWAETPYEEISRFIPRFPKTTGSVNLVYRTKNWNMFVTGAYQGTMYIDYFNEEVDPEAGNLSRIKETDPTMVFSGGISRTFGNWRLYCGVKNVFNTIQDEKRLDDPAFIYAPLYGRLIHAGLRIDIR
jgi:outer membrane receptor for ferrienterochelin and colicins